MICIKKEKKSSIIGCLGEDYVPKNLIAIESHHKTFKTDKSFLPELNSILHSEGYFKPRELAWSWEMSKMHHYNCLIFFGLLFVKKRCETAESCNNNQSDGIPSRRKIEKKNGQTFLGDINFMGTGNMKRGCQITTLHCA